MIASRNEVFVSHRAIDPPTPSQLLPIHDRILFSIHPIQRIQGYTTAGTFTRTPDLCMKLSGARGDARRRHRAICLAGCIQLRLCHGYLHSNVLTITQLNVRDLITKRLLCVFIFLSSEIRLKFDTKLGA